MSSVVLDSKALEQLQQFEGRVEIRNQAGELVGYFMPPDDRSLESLLYRDVEVPFTDEELDRFESEPGGRTLDEILKDLEKRS
ncbi:MAG TPA: hypothetical protein VFF52_02120 [Isosphaeraceae bacterium]|nr:hypothetical protein [Isosphaeraceae bacterium]